ncbi:hypothetical protein M422DRAFT_30187 [Sphaerobolus stellatus SS14]|uniref:Zn(2)-C6 fungal-type domain-containing protein n=1 Tax=Sphaerobolus stellatus (strain SS14) TaxID=990650 RepID=A0A0C9W0Q3_SPHS4|nr:hypothetical protein M422DRAFT_30187 [Sphaerobolus stellatus SS14]
MSWQNLSSLDCYFGQNEDNTMSLFGSSADLSQAPFLDTALPENDNTTYDRLRHRGSFSSTSGSSICEPPSPVAQRINSMSLDSTPNGEEEAEDAPWNLVAYHIPWGPGYEGYEAGTLPGPDGTCIFLRSPTPLKRQRTTQACEKCRERKAKCSGARPACGRCLDRGLTCYYSPSTNESQPSPYHRASRRLTPSNSKEQLKASIRNRVRRQSMQPDGDLKAEKQDDQLYPRSESLNTTPGMQDLSANQHGKGSAMEISLLEEDSTVNGSILGGAIYAEPASSVHSYRFPPVTSHTKSDIISPTPLAAVPDATYLLTTTQISSLDTMYQGWKPGMSFGSLFSRPSTYQDSFLGNFPGVMNGMYSEVGLSFHNPSTMSAILPGTEQYSMFSGGEQLLSNFPPYQMKREPVL